MHLASLIPTIAIANANKAAEVGGLDEYTSPELRPDGKGRFETGGLGDDEDGGYDMGGYDMGGFEDGEDGGIDDEEGGFDDDEAGGFDGSQSPDQFVEFGGKRGKRRRLFGKRRKNKKRKRSSGGAVGFNQYGQPVNAQGQVVQGPGLMPGQQFQSPYPQQAQAIQPAYNQYGQPIAPFPSVNPCSQLGYGGLQLATAGAPMSAGMPYVTVSSGIRIIEAPIPMESRIPASFLKHGLLNTALRTSQSPVSTTIAPAAGPFVLNIAPPLNGQLAEVIGVSLDIGPQPLNTQAGAQMTVAVSGKYVDGTAANLGNFRFLLPSTTQQMRIVFFFYLVQNGAPRPKQMFASNVYTDPYTATPDPVTQNIVLSGTAPAGLSLTGTLLGPANPSYENLVNALGAGCSC